MQLQRLKRLFSRLMHAPFARQPLAPVASGVAPASGFDPFWHGDHWQNLLSSPMDARRYVMEDWTATTADEWSADRAASAH